MAPSKQARRRWRVIVLTAAVLLAACADTTSRGATQEETSAMTMPGLQRIVDLAVADLAARAGVPAGDIAVVAAETVTWPDAGLGCPQPGRRYAQVPHDGARVHLRAGDRLYRYHTGGQVTEPFLCEQRSTKRPDPRAPGERAPDRRDPRLRPPGER